jgi:hypothetical protein
MKSAAAVISVLMVATSFAAAESPSAYHSKGDLSRRALWTESRRITPLEAGSGRPQAA